MAEDNFRILSKLKDGTEVIQAPWFKSMEDARNYIYLNGYLIFPGESAIVVKDFSRRTIPYWRANHPSNK